MRTNPNVIAKFRQLTGMLAALPGVSAEEDGPLRARLTIEGHPPLGEVTLRYGCKNRFWTRDYDPIFTCAASADPTLSGALRLVHRDGAERWAGSDPALAPIARRLNENPLLARKLGDLSLQKGALRFSGGLSEITLIPMAGIATRMLLPPLTHFTPPSPGECAGVLQCLQLILAELDRASDA